MLQKTDALLFTILLSAPLIVMGQEKQPSSVCVNATQKLQANDDWQIVSTVAKGDLLEFAAKGSWTYVSGAGHSSGPEGYSDPRPDAEPYRPQYAMPTAPIGALIARIGEQGEVFLVGGSKAITSLATGKLLMRMNDITGKPADNSGDVTVVYKICRFAS